MCANAACCAGRVPRARRACKDAQELAESTQTVCDYTGRTGRDKAIGRSAIDAAPMAWHTLFKFRGSIVVSISACHAEDPGSIPGRGVLCNHTWADYPLFLPLSLHTPMLKYVCLMHFCERTPSGSALHTSLLGVFAETQMCVGEIACHNIDVRSKSLSLCPFRLRRPGQGPGGAEAFFL